MASKVAYPDLYTYDLRRYRPYKESFKRAQAIDMNRRWTTKAFS